ncbi:unnamed protein product [Angiostrongylus costaricensis]|uniref:RING-type domain-containing protein n=1 Tax=Angiostrongylus costaricensis TaxID=334426 RepID=A0A3P7HPJ9_ANGCS|nr:unnamed protein product [Angiostrongylus costaricensis]
MRRNLVAFRKESKVVVCLSEIFKAYVLRCGHSFCELCLDEAVNWDDRCPECRRYTHGICIPNLVSYRN